MKVRRVAKFGTIAGVVGFIGVLAGLAILGTSTAAAYPGETADCTGCHAYRGGSLRITTDTTARTVAPGASFPVSISWIGGGGSRTEINWPNMLDNQQFTPASRIPYSGPNASGTTSSTLTAPAAAGTYTLRVYAAQKTPVRETDYKEMTITVAAPVTYAISVSASPAAGGTASGGGTFTTGTSVTVNAAVNAGYRFVNWTEGSTSVSTTAAYTFTASAARTLVANFIRTYAITVSASPSAGGSVSGGGTFNAGTSVTVNAAVNTGYHFVNWTERSTSVSTTAAYTFTASAARTLVANFAVNTPTSYTIGVSASPSAGGTVSGGGSYAAGTSVTVNAAVNAGYRFVNWTEGSTSVSTTAAYTFTASAARTLVANFIRTYAITVSASPSAGGSVSGGGTFNAGTSVTVNAAVNTGYHFVNWTERSTSVSTTAAYTFTASAARTLVANFAVNTPTSYTIGVSASPSAGGTVSGGGSYAAGTSVTVNAAVNAGYRFVNWTEGTTSVSTSPAYSLTVSAARTLVANFAIDTHTITPTAGANGSISPSGTVTVSHAADQSFTITAASGYHIAGIVVDGVPMATLQATMSAAAEIAVSNYTFTNVTASHTIAATFAPHAVTGSDTAGPLTTRLKFGSGREESGPATLNAVVDDTTTGGSNVVAAEYFLDKVGANGSGTPMGASDGSFNAARESVRAPLRFSGLASGSHAFYVRGRDAAGNWGPTTRLSFQVRTSRRISIGDVRIVMPDDDADRTSSSAIVIWIGTGRQQAADD